MSLQKLVAPMARRISNMLSRGQVTKSNAASKMQTLQISLLADEAKDAVEHFEPYGFTSNPKPGAEVLAAFIEGDRSHGIAVTVADRRYRVTGLQPGEVALHDDHGGMIKLSQSGISINGGSNPISITGAPTVTVTGGDVIADSVSLKSHVHRDVQPGTGLSGIPVGGTAGGGGGGGGSGVTFEDLENAVTAADASAVAALASEIASIEAKNAAISAKTDAILASAQAADSAFTAVTQATSASNSATVAGNSATSASESAATASGQASNASTSASAAASSATAAGNSAAAASTSASTASTAATNAGTSASEASTSATNAANSATAAGNSASAANTYKNEASTYATNAGDAASLASTYASNAAASQTAAGGSATAAATHASSASTSATNAANSAAAAAIEYSTLTTTVNGHTTSISNLTSTQNGLTARYGVTINNNGHISGFALNSDAAANGGNPTSAFVIQADKFVLIDPGTTYTDGNSPNAANIPFAVVSGVTYIKSAAIQNLSIGTQHLGANSVTNLSNSGNGLIGVTLTTANSLIDIMTIPSPPASGAYNCIINCPISTLNTNTSSNLVQLSFDVYVNGVNVASGSDYFLCHPINPTRSAPIKICGSEISFNVNVGDTVQIKTYGFCEDANKLAILSIYSRNILFKK